MKCICNFYHIGICESIAGDSEETVGVAGDIDLDIALLDVVGLGIVGKAIRQQADNADACTGETDLDVCGMESVYVFLCPGDQVAVHDVVVEVDAHDPVTKPDANVVIACCGERSIKCCEGGRVIHTGSACGVQHIRHFDLIAVP